MPLHKQHLILQVAEHSQFLLGLIQNWCKSVGVFASIYMGISLHKAHWYQLEVKVLGILLSQAYNLFIVGARRWQKCTFRLIIISFSHILWGSYQIAAYEKQLLWIDL